MGRDFLDLFQFPRHGTVHAPMDKGVANAEHLRNRRDMPDRGHVVPVEEGADVARADRHRPVLFLTHWCKSTEVAPVCLNTERASIGGALLVWHRFLVGLDEDGADDDR